MKFCIYIIPYTDCDSDHRLSRSNSKDVDHRNLISLTGSPGNEVSPPEPPASALPPPPAPPTLWAGTDQVNVAPITGGIPKVYFCYINLTITQVCNEIIICIR